MDHARRHPRRGELRATRLARREDRGGRCGVFGRRARHRRGPRPCSRRNAPELNIVAVASGGTPADLKSAAQAFDKRDRQCRGVLARAFRDRRHQPRLHRRVPDSILNDKGRAAVAALKDGCVGGTGDGSPAPDRTFRGLRDDRRSVELAERSRDLSEDPPAAAPGRTPIAEIYVYHSQIDELLPIAGTDAMVSSWCADGAKVHYYRGIAGEHVVFALTGGPDAALFLESRLARAPADPCRSRRRAATDTPRTANISRHHHRSVVLPERRRRLRFRTCPPRRSDELESARRP